MDILSLGTIPSTLTQDDVIAIKTLYEELRRICALALERQVAVVIDAEHSGYTPAIDAITLALTREFNRPSGRRSDPLVYGTYQSYLRRGIDHLRTSLSEAKREGYTLGIKLVRGAYHTFEVSAHRNRISGASGNEVGVPPVWTRKNETDYTYNTSIDLLLSNLANDRLDDGKPRLSILFGTHNQESCNTVLNGLVDRGLAVRKETRRGMRIYMSKEVADRISFGQLMGMGDELTQYLADTVITPVPIVLKYVPYGGLQEVIPYLARRAIENKSVLGGDRGAANERRIAGAELRRRLFPFYGSVSRGSSTV